MTEYGQQVLCAHPDCLRVFIATRGDRDYCDEHARQRMHAKRLRVSRPPKVERCSFHLAPGVNGVRYAWSPLAVETEISPAGRFARDEEELLQLAALVEQGVLVAVDTR